MAMRIKKYTGSTVTEVLNRVKDEMGIDAVILNTRTGQGNGSEKTLVEVTAAVDGSYPVGRGQPPRSRIIRNVTPEVTKETSSLVQEIKDLKEILHSITEYGRYTRLPGALPALVRCLIDNGVEEPITKALVHWLLVGLRGEEFNDRELIEERVIGAFEEMVSTNGGIKLRENGATVVCFVGPTGSGKTTTIAKVATEFALVRKAPVSIVTTDTKKVGAVAQLESYAEIIGVPLTVVYTPEEMKDALPSDGSRLVLVDTTGTGPHDEPGLTEVATFLKEASPDQTYVVISATTGFRSIVETFNGFKSLPVTGLLFTKLDETRAFGPILSAAITTKGCISYFTHGRSLPDGIEVADVRRLAQRVIRRNGRDG